MTLYEMIMDNMNKLFTRLDWAALGRGDITDEDTIGKMLMQGYEAVVNED